MIEQLHHDLGRNVGLAPAYLDGRVEGTREHRRRSREVRAAAARALDSALATHRAVAACGGETADLAELVLDYLHTWRVDLGRWRKRVKSPRRSVIAALLDDPQTALFGDSGRGEFTIPPAGNPASAGGRRFAASGSATSA